MIALADSKLKGYGRPWIDPDYYVFKDMLEGICGLGKFMGVVSNGKVLLTSTPKMPIDSFMNIGGRK